MCRGGAADFSSDDGNTDDSILADAGCTQYEIMAIHGHSQPQTSARYTKGANRWRLVQGAMNRLSDFG